VAFFEKAVGGSEVLGIQKSGESSGEPGGVAARTRSRKGLDAGARIGGRRRHGLDYLQVIEDGDGGEVTSLLPTDY
jgi:hypothetical protein